MNNLQLISQIDERLKKAGVTGVGVSVVDGQIKITGENADLVARIQARVDRGEIDIRHREAKTAAEIYDELAAKLTPAQLLRRIGILAISSEMSNPNSQLWALVDRLKPPEGS